MCINIPHTHTPRSPYQAPEPFHQEGCSKTCLRIMNEHCGQGIQVDGGGTMCNSLLSPHSIHLLFFFNLFPSSQLFLAKTHDKNLIKSDTFL